MALKVALMPTMDCLPFYYAERCHIYKELGLDVRIQTFNAQMDVDTAFIRGHADVAYTDFIRAALLQDGGTSLYVIMQAYGFHELVTTKAKRMRNIKHLKERMVAIARHSVTDLLLDTVIQQSGVDPTMVYRPQINDIILRHDMVDNATLDAAFLPEPYVTQLRLKGNRVLYSARKDSLQLMAFMTGGTTVNDERKANQIRLLLKGYNMATERMARGEAADSIRRILQAFSLRTETIDSLKIPHYRPAEKAQPQNVATAVRFLRSRRLLKGDDYTGDTLINNRFMP